MRKLVLASSLLLGILLVSPGAFARGGRTFALKTVLGRPLGALFLKDFQEKSITVRTPLGVSISRQQGSPTPGIPVAAPFVPVTPKVSPKGNSLLFKLGQGRYYVAPHNQGFSILRSPILTTR
jgi:hypothetical protein